jgi:hypothetical protein
MNTPDPSQIHQAVTETVKITPPAVYIGAEKLMGITPTDFVTYLTILYLLIQIMIAIPKWKKQYGPWLSRRYLALGLWIKSKGK